MTSVTTAGSGTERSGFRVEPHSDGGHRLHVTGKLPIDWVGNLACGLSRNGVSITHGKVFREGAMSWHGHIALKRAATGTPPERIDYQQLVRSAAERPDAAVWLDSFQLRQTSEQGGTLFLEIEGEDQHGFLGIFLDRLSFYSLFPAHLEIETFGGRIHDRFWLQGVGGTQPTETIARALRRALEKMVTKSA